VVKRAWWVPPVQAIGIVLAILAPVWLCGCKSGSPGVRVSVGFLGAEVSVQIGGGDLAPHATIETPPPTDATPPTPTEDPKDGEGVTPKPEGP